MSVEDTELRDLLMQTLEQNGTLAKLRAQLRASVFLAFEEQSSVKYNSALVNDRARDFAASDDGKLCAALISDFMRSLNMGASLSVFEPEVGMGGSLSSAAPSRDALEAELGLSTPELQASNTPLLSLVLKRFKDKKPVFNGNSQSMERNGDSVAKLHAAEFSDFSSKSKEGNGISKVNETVTKKTDYVDETSDDDFFQNVQQISNEDILTKVVSTSDANRTRQPSAFDSLLGGGNSAPVQKSSSIGMSSLLGDLPQLSKNPFPPLGGVANSSSGLLTLGSIGMSKTGPAASALRLPSSLFDNDDNDFDDDKTPELSLGDSVSKKSDRLKEVGKPAKNQAAVLATKDLPHTHTESKAKPIESRGTSTDEDISEEIPEDIEVDDISQHSTLSF